MGQSTPRRFIQAIPIAAVVLLIGCEAALRLRSGFLIRGRAVAARSARRTSPKPPDTAERPEVVIVALGDSLVAGYPGSTRSAWPALLASHLTDMDSALRWTIHNAGRAGDTAPLGWQRFEHDVVGQGPDLILIAFGMNDCNPARRSLDTWTESQTPSYYPGSAVQRTAQVRLTRWGRRRGWLPAPPMETTSSHLPRTSLTGYRRALTSLVRTSCQSQAMPVLLTMTPLSRQRTPATVARLDRYASYNQIIRAVARTYRVALVDLDNTMSDDCFEQDGVHLAPKGQATVADQVFRQLAPIWEACVQRLKA